MVTKPSSATMRRKAGSSSRSRLTSARRSHGAWGVARRLHAGSKGLRTARMPAARAARSTGRNTEGKMCTCLCVSMWVSLTPLDCSSAICAAVSASISEEGIRPVRSRSRNPPSEDRKRPLTGSARLGISRRGASTGSPSTSTTWQPTPRVSVERAIAMPSSVAAPRAISVALVSAPAPCSSATARLTPEVNPKSSALRMRRPTP